jgi:MFS family permease
VPVRRARAAVTAVFFLNGVVFVSWYSRLPDIQEELDIGDGALGLALLGAPVGLLIAMPLAGALTSAIGSRPLVMAAPLWVSAVVLPGVATSVATLALATFVVGAANGVLDISMNIQGLAVERLSPRRLFNSLHAAFSFGALAGALAGGAAAAAGMEPLTHLAIVAAVGAAAAAIAATGLLPADAEPRTEGPHFARPSRRLAALGAIAFGTLLAEGAVFDWSGILLARETDASAGLAPAGLAAFNLAMGFGRLSADAVSERFGSVEVGRAGALLAAASLGAALALGTTAAAIAGFAVMGIGVAALFPLALRAAGYDPDLAGPAVAAVSTLGYAGFLTGPPTIGFLAEAVGLSGALGFVCVLLLLVAALASHLAVRTRASV